MMKTKRFLMILCALLCVLSVLTCVGSAAADAKKAVLYTNPETGYRAEILDDLGLLTGDEKKILLDAMIPITDYGHIGFVSTDQHASNTVEQARLIRKGLFGMDSASVFVVNMKDRQLSIQSYGEIYKYITSSKANSITDNVHSYATNGDYCTAAAEAYRQMADVISGVKIAEPMRCFSYAAIALMGGMIGAICLIFLTNLNPNIRGEKNDAQNAVEVSLAIYNNVVTSRKFVARSNGSSGGCGGGGCGGGGCGGGGSSGF